MEYVWYSEKLDMLILLPVDGPDTSNLYDMYMNGRKFAERIIYLGEL